jgi:hypothetical protein
LDEVPVPDPETVGVPVPVPVIVCDFVPDCVPDTEGVCVPVPVPDLDGVPVPDPVPEPVCVCVIVGVWVPDPVGVWVPDPVGVGDVVGVLLNGSLEGVGVCVLDNVVVLVGVAVNVVVELSVGFDDIDG